MQHTMRLSSPMMVFGDPAALQRVHNARSKHSGRGHRVPTVYVVYNLTSFRTAELQGKPARPTGSWVWTEKVQLVRLASLLAPECIQWFAWYDAGTNLFRTVDPPAMPWPTVGALARLPQSRVIVNFKGENPHCTRDHRKAQAWADLCVAGTGWISHRALLSELSNRYYAMFSKCMRSTGGAERCLDDQFILSAMLDQDQSFFFSIGRGWAGYLVNLFNDTDAVDDLNGSDFQPHTCTPRPHCVTRVPLWHPGRGLG